LLLNGIHNDQIPVTDRGLQYGDGLFETLAVVNGKPQAWHRHMARLARGEDALLLPRMDRSQLLREAESLCEGCERGVLKILITRGSGGRGYRPPVPCEPRRILSLHPWPEIPPAWYSEGMQLRVCDMRWGRNPRLAGLKHLNRLEQVLARQEWDDPRIAEGLMLDELDSVISGTQSNLFLLRSGRLLTPDLSCSGIAGTMRERVIESAVSLDLPVEITSLKLDDVMAADGLFMSNSLWGLCPVSRLLDKHYALTVIPPPLRDAVARGA
jgi:4-amino-4-deoxychorismate lyase